MAKRLLVFVLFATLVAVAAAIAHEDQRHIMGTVAIVRAGELVVEAQDGKTVSILLTEDTVYRSIAQKEGMGVMAKDTDLKPGSRVVVDVGAEGPKFTATQVRFSSAPKEADGRGGQHYYSEVP